jgi:TatD DNase family protein
LVATLACCFGLTCGKKRLSEPGDEREDMTRLFDTHAHLDDEQFTSIRGEVVARAQAAGLERILTVATTANSSAACMALAAEYPMIYAAVGIHPNSCQEAAGDDWDRVIRLASGPKIVALGETGLDRYWDDCPFAVQQDYFDRHIALSQQTGLPFIVHMRDCEEDVLKTLEVARSRGPLRGVMHSFTGSLQTAERCLELGLFVSFAGMVTYKKSDELRSIASAIPADRILVETDSPYLSPHPHRGQRPNEPALIAYTASCIAKSRGEDGESFAERATQNAYELFQRAR